MKFTELAKIIEAKQPMKRGAGVLVFNAPTKEFLLQKRGPNITDPGQHDFFGGGVDEGENILDAAYRETEEEGGFTVDPKEAFYPLAVYGKNPEEGLGGYYIFLVVVYEKFEPKINYDPDVPGEVESADWLDSEALKKVHLHHRVRTLFAAPGFKDSLLKAVKMRRAIFENRNSIDSYKAAEMIAQDDDLFDTVATYTTEVDVFTRYPEELAKFLTILNRVKPIKKRLWRGEVAGEERDGTPVYYDTRHPFTSWSAARDVAQRDFASDRNHILSYTDGPNKAISLTDIATARMRLFPGESHYSGGQAEYFVLEPVDRHPDWELQESKEKCKYGRRKDGKCRKRRKDAYRGGYGFLGHHLTKPTPPGGMDDGMNGGMNGMNGGNGAGNGAAAPGGGAGAGTGVGAGAGAGAGAGGAGAGAGGGGGK